MAGFQISGLVSGSLNWQTIVSQLMDLEAVPITKLEKEQSTNTSKINALDSLSSKLTALKTATEALGTSTVYTKRSATSSTSGSTWSFSAADGTVAGAYKINVSTLATAATQRGGANIGRFLAPDGNTAALTIGTMPTAMAVTAGTFSVNGKQVTVGLTDTFESVLTQIGTATGGKVTASYNNLTDKLELVSNDGNPIMLGASNDTSNFISAMSLGGSNNALSLTSSNRLGTTSLNSPLGTASLATGLTNLDADNKGSFSINGVQIDYDADTDSLSAIISRINASSAGVTASYDSSRDQMLVTNSNTGDTAITMADGANGNLLAALGLTGAGAVFTRGKNAEFSINDGATRTSPSNTLDGTYLGVTGLSVTAKDTGTQTITVAADTSQATSKINGFITAFNAVQDYIESQTKITKTATGKVTTSTLTDNREIQEWARSMRSLAFGAIGGSTTVKQLADMGIDFVSGTNNLQVKDSAKLESALKNNATDVTNLFTSETGFAAKFKTFFNSVLGDGVSKGNLSNQTENLNKANRSMDDQILVIENRIEQQRAILTAQFMSMQNYQQKANTVLAQLSRSFSS